MRGWFYQDYSFRRRRQCDCQAFLPPVLAFWQCCRLLPVQGWVWRVLREAVQLPAVPVRAHILPGVVDNQKLYL
jgi:hypothetical protein